MLDTSKPVCLKDAPRMSCGDVRRQMDYGSQQLSWWNVRHPGWLQSMPEASPELQCSILEKHLVVQPHLRFWHIQADWLA